MNLVSNIRAGAVDVVSQPIAAPVSGAFKVDTTKGSHIGRVSSEWYSRPADEKFLSLDSLASSVRERSARCKVTTVESRDVIVVADRSSPDKLQLQLPNAAPAAPTHWAFGQAASLISAPAAYLRTLPAPIAAINLQYGLSSVRSEMVKAMAYDDGRVELRAITGPDYGRIWDHEIVAAVQRVAGNGTGDTCWKVPGMLNWANGTYNPYVDITADTTTLYASDRDVFLFLVDDTHPIEAGRLPDGSPDLYFRGFYVWNSEVGAKTAGMASFYLRGVCQNRNLWGVEEFSEIKIRHSKFAARRFAHEAAPALHRFANSSPAPFMQGIAAARQTIVAQNEDERLKFAIERGGLGKGEAQKVLDTVLREEGHPAESVFDFVQGITAVARTRTHQDARLDMEAKAKRLLDKVAA